jgi:hypothetical protein
LNETWEPEEDDEVQRMWEPEEDDEVKRMWEPEEDEVHWMRIWRTNGFLQCFCESEEPDERRFRVTFNVSMNLKNEHRFRLRVNNLEDSIENEYEINRELAWRLNMSMKSNEWEQWRERVKEWVILIS